MRLRVAPDHPGQALQEDEQTEGHDDRVEWWTGFDRSHQEPFGDSAEDETGRHRGDERDPVVDTVLLGQIPRDERREHQHRALGEVHDPRRPPDHDQRQGNGGVDHAVADTAEGEVQEAEHGQNPR